MDNTTALILTEAIEEVLEQADGLSQAELKELVEQKAEEQRVCLEVRAAWAAFDEGRVK